MQTQTYSPSVFDVTNLDQAKSIILTPEGGSTEERWAKETPAILDLLTEHTAKIDNNSLIIDYGCGVGRLSKELIARFGCRVIGVDISPSMRALATVYVGHPHFLACAPEMLPTLGAQADLALSVWVLQHCYKPQEDISRLYTNLKPQGELFVVNNYVRAVPTIQRTWANDGVDVNALLEARFVGAESGHLPEEVCPPRLSEATYWRRFVKA